MYLEYFNLSEQPFSITPDPDRAELEWYFELLDAQTKVDRKEPA